MTENRYSFENFIMQCCKAHEYELRSFIKKTLLRAGFTIKEDNYYSSHRNGKYKNIPNLLAMRGKPSVCLVAHTDTCREHNIEDTVRAEPDIKKIDTYDGIKEVITDKNNMVQVGGDDRLGVAINLWIALNTGYDMGLLFTTDEEVGVISAGELEMPEIKEFELLVQVDRGNHSNQLVSKIGGVKLCSEKLVEELLKISRQIDLPRREVEGFLTDVYAIKKNKMCKNAVNMTCGYHGSYGASADEYIDIQEARDTMKFVANIVKYFYI